MWILKFKPVNCKNCYKCVRHCPVKAIKIKNHQAQIMQDTCILCENCTIVCPQNAKQEKNDIPILRELIENGRKLIATVSPAYIAEYGSGSFSFLREALMKLGFLDVYEASQGTYLVKAQYEEVLEKESMDVVLTSSCPTIVRLIKKRYPELRSMLMPVLSPMQASAGYVKEHHPGAQVVYISPCISPIAELYEDNNYTNYVITFDELKDWFLEEGITIENAECEIEPKRSRMAAISGGFTDILNKNDAYEYVSIDGVENCIHVLDEIKEGKFHKCFVELNACVGGCVGGPSFRKQKAGILKATLDVKKSAYGDVENKDHDICTHVDLSRSFDLREVKEELPNEEELKDILEQMGKNSVKDELNCGACGYDTCREKAVAIFQKKAEISMCIPYMREREASYANKIINSMPGLLVTVDKKLNIVQLNKTAVDLFDIRRKKEIIGKPISKLMDDYVFVNMLSYDKNFSHDQIFLEEYKVYLDRVITYDKQNGLMICVMKNITKEILQKQETFRNRVSAAQMADKIVEEQLRIVHEIASLLGETAADTKVAVEKLKSTIMQDVQEEEKHKKDAGRWL